MTATDHRPLPRRFAPLAAALLLGAAGCAGPDPVFFGDGGGDYTLQRDTLGCLPDNNGVIARDELLFVPGATANYRVNPPGTLVTFDPKGSSAGGRPEWDFSSLQGSVVKLTVEPLRDQWFAASFPGAELASPADAAARTYQILDLQPDRVLLLGLASRQKDQTLIVYDPPVEAMRFPLQPGVRFSATASSKAGAKLNGLPIATRDTYAVAITAEGSLRLPSLRLSRVLRVETTVTSRAVGGVTAVTRQLQWFAECYGEVVRAVSKTNETNPHFSQATELRRLAF